MRYRKNYRQALGRPDIAFIRIKLAVFCDSSFWHGRDWGRLKIRLEKSGQFWVSKILRNIERDKSVNKGLREQGWTVLRFWDTEITNQLEACVDRIVLEQRRLLHKDGVRKAKRHIQGSRAEKRRDRIVRN
jgi:DNA mismatch endonuclease (patch repair protein)